MAIDRRAKVVHDPLADRVREQRLGDAERAGGDGDGDHADDEEGEQGGVARRDGVVEHGAQEEGRDHAQPGGDRDEREHGAEAAAVGTEEAEQAAAVEGGLGTLASAAPQTVQHERPPHACAATRVRYECRRRRSASLNGASSSSSVSSAA